MAVKILIKRKIPKGFEDPKFNKLIRQLRRAYRFYPRISIVVAGSINASTYE